MNNSKTKISLLKEVFKKHNYNLNVKDFKDLKRRLISKPIQLYLLVIKLLEKNNAKINYQNVKNLIILDIRIRDNVKKVITALEESIWVQYIDSKIDFNDYEKLKKLSSKNIILYNVINQLEKNDLHLIREIRNDVNHIVYPIIFNKFEKLIQQILKLKNIDFIENRIINALLIKIYQAKKDLELNFIDDLFRRIYQENKIFNLII